MFNIILATSNPHKITEINALNTDENISFDIIRGDFNPVENGTTFLENAYIKASSASKIVNAFCLADDSGLCVDALQGRPGIYSSRYDTTPQRRINKLLSELKNVDKEFRSAHFSCAMVLTDPSGNIVFSKEGRVDGFIDFEPKGSFGFGYDPVFYLPRFDKTMAQLPDQIKNQISHRAKAFNLIIEEVKKNLL